MNTNGRARSPTWKREMAAVLDVCQIETDGLAVTNHLYRRRTSCRTIMQNATPYIAAGGVATWEYIVSRHSEHQIDKLKARAFKMGFRRFRARKAGRFFFGGELRWVVSAIDEFGNQLYEIDRPGDDHLVNSQAAELG